MLVFQQVGQQQVLFIPEYRARISRFRRTSVWDIHKAGRCRRCEYNTHLIKQRQNVENEMIDIRTQFDRMGGVNEQEISVPQSSKGVQ